MSENRECWGSRFGFIMATAGFAIGLGSVWRFPYMVGVNGGGAFLFVYLFICFAICVPLFVAEVSLGRKTRLNPIQGMQALAKKKHSPWALIGWLGALASLLIMSYYVMILGWMAAYLIKMLSGQFTNVTPEQASGIFKTFASNPVEVILYTLAMMIVLGVIVTRGLKNGVEKACKTMLPALFLMIFILAVRSVTLPGSLAGLKWYLTPDFSKINGAVVLAALGQAFFAVGIGVATAFIYGSYLSDDSDLPSDSAIIVFLVTLIAFVCGLIIFPALSSFGMSPEAGPGLVFETMPVLFAKIPMGRFFGIMFFFLVVLAGLTSGIGYLEAVASTLADLFRMSRKTSTWFTLALIFILGVPSILSQGPWKDVMIFGRNCFDLADYISGNILMPLGALMISVYTAYVWKFSNFMNESNVGARGFVRVSGAWKPLIVMIIPVAVAAIMIKGL